MKDLLWEYIMYAFFMLKKLSHIIINVQKRIIISLHLVIDSIIFITVR